jgi:hypothetical protein
LRRRLATPFIALLALANAARLLRETINGDYPVLYFCGALIVAGFIYLLLSTIFQTITIRGDEITWSSWGRTTNFRKRDIGRVDRTSKTVATGARVDKLLVWSRDGQPLMQLTLNPWSEESQQRLLKAIGQPQTSS